MQKLPSDDDFRQTYRVFEGDHDDLRGELLAAIARGDHLRFAPNRFATSGKWFSRGLVALAACAALAAGAWLAFVGSSPTPAFALEGIHERLLKIHSLHVTGRKFETVNVDGMPKREEFPIEFYAERPARSWGIWHGFSFSPDGDRVKSGISVADGARQLWISHTDKRAIMTKAAPLATELRVEFELQNHWTRQIVEGSTTDYRLIGKDEVDGDEAIQYETVQHSPRGKTRNVVWVHSQTGLPMRSAWYQIDANGKEQLSHIYDRIRTNVPPRPEMFSFDVPEGYQLERKDEPGGDQFPPLASGSAGADQLAVRFVFAIDERAGLVCWLHKKRGPDGPPRRGWVVDFMRMEFSGANPKRPCEWHFVRKQQDGDQLWIWSLVLPRDHRTLMAGEPLDIVFEGRAGVITMSNGPLRFDDGRLATILDRLQAGAFSEPSDEPPFTLADLRKKVDEILAAAEESNEPDRRQP